MIHLIFGVKIQSFHIFYIFRDFCDFQVHISEIKN